MRIYSGALTLSMRRSLSGTNGIWLAVSNVCAGSISERLMAIEKRAGQQIGMTAMLALLGAITGVVMIFVGKPGWGLLLAVCAAVLGAIGFFIRPRRG